MKNGNFTTIKFHDVWNKNGNSIKKEFDNKHIYYKRLLKTKIKFYSDEAIKALPIIASYCTCWAIILIYFVLKKDENY